MSAASTLTADNANLDAEVGFGNRRRALRLNHRVMQKAENIARIKTAAYLSDETGYSTRACEAWLSRKVVIPSDALAMLIQSDHGRAYLAAVMADTAPRWWVVLQAFFRRITAEELRDRSEREYKEMLNEEARAARSNTPAMLLQDEDFYTGQPAPHRSMASKKRNWR